jgi:hypothetical protein
MFGIEVLKRRMQKIGIADRIRHFNKNPARRRAEPDKRSNGCVHILNMFQNSCQRDQIEGADVLRQIARSALICFDSFDPNMGDADGRRIDADQI